MVDEQRCVWCYRCILPHPPKQIRPADKISITMSVTVNKPGSDYSASGDFSIYFDKPEIQNPGLLFPRWIERRQGRRLFYKVHISREYLLHRHPVSRYILMERSSKGKKGDRIALLAVLYCRSAGYKYLMNANDNCKHFTTS